MVLEAPGKGLRDRQRPWMQFLWCVATDSQPQLKVSALVRPPALSYIRVWCAIFGSLTLLILTGQPFLSVEQMPGS